VDASGGVAEPGVVLDRREKVLESALVTFARFGYRKASMEQVAQDAGISRPGLYFLFTSKEHLVHACVLRALERDLALVAETLDDTARPLSARLLDAFDHWAGRSERQETGRLTLGCRSHPVAVRQVGFLPAEGGEVGGEHVAEEGVVLHAGGGHDLAEADSGEGSGDDVGGGHAGHRGEVHALDFVELGGDDAGAHDVGADPGSGELGVQGLGHRDRRGQ